MSGPRRWQGSLFQFPDPGPSASPLPTSGASGEGTSPPNSRANPASPAGRRARYAYACPKDSPAVDSTAPRSGNRSRTTPLPLLRCPAVGRIRATVPPPGPPAGLAAPLTGCVSRPFAQWPVSKVPIFGSGVLHPGHSSWTWVLRPKTSARVPPTSTDARTITFTATAVLPASVL